MRAYYFVLSNGCADPPVSSFLVFVLVWGLTEACCHRSRCATTIPSVYIPCSKLLSQPYPSQKGCCVFDIVQNVNVRAQNQMSSWNAWRVQIVLEVVDSCYLHYSTCLPMYRGAISSGITTMTVARSCHAWFPRSCRPNVRVSTASPTAMLVCTNTQGKAEKISVLVTVRR